MLRPLAKSVLIPLGLTAAASAIDGAIQKKMFELGIDYTEEQKEEQKGGFLGILLGILGAN